MLDEIILSNLVRNTEFRSRVASHLVPDHFGESKALAAAILVLAKKYKDDPKAAQLGFELDSLQAAGKISTEENKRLHDVVTRLYSLETMDTEWLVNASEKFTRDKSIYNAILKAIQVYDKKDTKLSVDDLPALLSNAIAVTFEPDYGAEFADAERRWEKYSTQEERIPFRSDTFNFITNGGAMRKTLNIVQSPINSGKTMKLIDFAAGYLLDGIDVAYFTMEMSEWEILKRIDANLLGIDIAEIEKIPHDDFIAKVQDVNSKTKDRKVGKARLFVKEFATGVGNTTLFGNYLDTLWRTSGFKPDVIIVDYLGICGSNIKGSVSLGSYQHLKNISVELRAFAQKTNTVLWTAMQVNREGMKEGNSGMTATSESMGVPMTADFILGQIRTPEYDAQGKILMTQAKSRYGSVADYPSFPMYVNLKQQRYDDDMVWLDGIKRQKQSGVSSSFSDSAAFVPSSFAGVSGNWVGDSLNSAGLKI